MNFLRKHWKVFAAVTFVILGAGLFLFNRVWSSKSKVQEFERPQYLDIKQSIEVSGSIDAKEKATLRFLAGGKLTYVGAKEGDSVKKWQTIASIDKQDLQKNLEKDLNSYAIQRWTFDQNVDNRKDIYGNKSTDRLKDQDQFTLNNTVLTVELRDIALRNASLYAPFNGVLISAPTAVPGTILLSTDVFTVINPESMVFIADVDESDISKIKEGLPATIGLDAFSKIEIPVTVDRIAFQSKEKSTGTVFPIEFRLQSQFDGVMFRLGMNGSVRIETASKNQALTIPLRAITERDDKLYVEVKTTTDKTEQREIRTGIENDDYVEVTEGLSDQDEVLLR